MCIIYTICVCFLLQHITAGGRFLYTQSLYCVQVHTVFIGIPQACVCFIHFLVGMLHFQDVYMCVVMLNNKHNTAVFVPHWPCSNYCI